MSSGGQIAGGIVGAIVGYVGTGFNPAGAYYGAMIGAGIGGYLDPPKGPTVEGPRLNDLKVQTSTYGVIVPRVYGMIGISGNVLWLENNQLKETVKKKKQGGKGGGSSSTLKTYSYSATFALGLCEGPIAGVRRIWCGDRLIYNAGSDDLETIIASNQAASGFGVYLGTDDQLPDSRYEANVGVGNAPAFRGLAYIVFYDFQLADYGNSLQGAQFKVEVYKKGQTEDYILLIDKEIQLETGGVINGVVTNDLYSCAYIATSGASGGSGRDVTISSQLSFNDSIASSLLYNSIGFKSSDRRNYAFWQGPSYGYYNTRYGVLKPGTSISDEYFVEKDKIVYFCGHNSSTVRIVDYVEASSPDSFRSFTVFPMIGHAVNDGRMYGVSSDLSKIYTYDASDFSLIETKNLSSALGFSTYVVNSVHAYHDGSLYYIQGFNLTNEPVYSINPASGAVSLYFNAPLRPGNLNRGSIRVFGNLFYRLYTNDGSLGSARLRVFKVPSNDKSEEFVSEVIEAEVELSNLLSSTDIDVSLISDSIGGYKISGGSLRQCIEPLQGAFPFDVRQHGYVLQCVPRGQSAIASILQEDLGASEDGSSALLETSREMDSQLPVRTTVKYIDASREYDTAEQYSERVNTKAVNRVDREFPIAMGADKAAQVAEMLEFAPWIERSEYKFTLPPTMLGVEPADVISVTTDEALYEFRLVETNENPDGSVECKGRPNKASLWSSSASGGESPGPDGTIGVSGSTIFLPLDIPLLDETLQDSPGFVGVATSSSSSWPGAVVFRSNDGGQTWTDIQGFSGKATIGRARGMLPISACVLIDQSTIIVDMISGEVSSVTCDQMLSGQNYAAYGVNGRWEIIRFQSAELQADGSYVVSGFVRGECGTEWATGLHSAYDWFVLLEDPDNQFIGMQNSSIGQQLLYRGITNGADILSEEDQSFTYAGVNLECLSPVYAKGSRDGSGNFTGTFTRRSRVSGTWWGTGTPSPVGESAESYEIDVMSGSTVKRTIASTSESFSYSAANQVTDFGSAQSAITFRIYQMSAVVGRGYPLEVTL